MNKLTAQLLIFSFMSFTSLVALAEEPPFDVTPVATFNAPWAMTFLPDGRLLVTEKPGDLYVVDQQGNKSKPVKGVPDVDYRGQGGLGDVILHPDFDNNQSVYLSYVEAGEGNTRGAAVMRARLQLVGNQGQLMAARVIWRQYPKVSGSGHYGHRLVFDDAHYLFISSGERQKFTPAQQMDGNLGKIVRLFDDGTIPEDNPFASEGGISAQIWSLGHRNPLGLFIDAQGRLWNHEMGPRHGDEVNLIIKGGNYGYPIVSEGDHYSGKRIPDHHTRPEFEAPKIAWIPTVAPSGVMYYAGDRFPSLKDSVLIGGLKSRAIVQVKIDGDNATEVARFDMGNRIRELEQGPDGAIWVLEDGSGGRLLKLTPRQQTVDP